MDISTQCQTCGKEATKKCTGCYRAVYCDASCQKADRKEHKKTCFPEGATCTRCLQVIDINKPCTVPHPPHMLEQIATHVPNGGSANWIFKCKSCNRGFVKASANSEGMDATPIVSGEKFCYNGHHTIKPLKEDN